MLSVWPLCYVQYTYFPLTTNQILNLWNCRCLWHRRFWSSLNSLIFSKKWLFFFNFYFCRKSSSLVQRDVESNFLFELWWFNIRRKENGAAYSSLRRGKLQRHSLLSKNCYFCLCPSNFLLVFFPTISSNSQSPFSTEKVCVFSIFHMTSRRPWRTVESRSFYAS